MSFTYGESEKFSLHSHFLKSDSTEFNSKDIIRNLLKAIGVQLKIRLIEHPIYCLRDKHEFPTKSGIYVVRSEKKIIYIGQTLNLRKRFNPHGYIKRFNQKGAVDLLFYELLFADRKVLLDIEESFIRALNPEINNRHNKDR